MFIVNSSIKFYYDNKTTINISHNTIQQDRAKHVKVYIHFIKEKIDDVTICMTYVLTKEQTLDIITKKLPRQNFDDFIRKLV